MIDSWDESDFRNQGWNGGTPVMAEWTQWAGPGHSERWRRKIQKIVSHYKSDRTHWVSIQPNHSELTKGPIKTHKTPLMSNQSDHSELIKRTNQIS